ncbi:T9SS type A sorting domain-containing protein [Flavobacterium sp. CLA17]|uniref:T9SS type A sorting domain-containing protein n=1 Tax=Flavobacterium sp. CLA17 TaxID=2724135 RepID=UPI0014924C38|nr:T9SS type A sorting domain-containing protein [Flavobacterium sp. CLA17]QSB26135.1 T9SS type A sorting domain-containing protein [Flavobacterium sp. CLA17]
MKKTLLLLALFSIIITQAQSIQWQKPLGGPQFEEGRCIQQTNDGGYIVAGYSHSSIGNRNEEAYIVKLNASGTIEWEKKYGGTGNDFARSIQQTADGGYMIAGSTTSNDGDVSGNHGGADYWIVKLDAAGTIAWQKTYGGTSYDKAESIRQTSDGGYIMVGYAYSNNGDVSGNHGEADIWIVKIDATGTIVWQKSLGGTRDDFAEKIIQTADGGYIMAGGTTSNNGDVSGNHSLGLDFWIVKLDGTGTITWKKCLGGTDEDFPTSIQQTTDGGYILTGNTGSTNGDVVGNHDIIDNIKTNDAWVVKLNATGTIQWQKCLGGTASEDPSSIQQTSDGGYIVAGDTNSNDGDVSGKHGNTDVWIVKLDVTGNIQWQKCLGGSSHETVYSNQQTSDGGYIMTGITNSTDGDVIGNNGNFDFWTVKLAPVILGLNDNTKSIVKLYPNPAHESLQLQTTNPVTAIKITDVTGKIVKEENVKGSSNTIHQINIESLPQGLYILEAYTGTEKYTEKFLKN